MPRRKESDLASARIPPETDPKPDKIAPQIPPIRQSSPRDGATSGTWDGFGDIPGKFRGKMTWGTDRALSYGAQGLNSCTKMTWQHEVLKWVVRKSGRKLDLGGCSEVLGGG